MGNDAEPGPPVSNAAQTGVRSKPISNARAWTGWILSVLPSLMLLSGFAMAFSTRPQVLQGMTHLGYGVKVLPILGTIELICAVLYLIPRTAFFGAVLLTAYFGGAVASHVRIGESQFVLPIIFGIVVWTGLYLRDPRLSSLATFRRPR